MDRNTKLKLDDTTGLPLLSGVYSLIKNHFKTREEVGFLYFDIANFRGLEEKYGHVQCKNLLKLVGLTLKKQKGMLYRDEDLVVVGGKGLDYFVLFLFSPPRKKKNFANHDLKLISARIKQKLVNVIHEHLSALSIDGAIDFHTGYTVIKNDPHMEVERLIYEARKEAGLKAQLEEIMVQFIANISHELRTPLTSIKGYAETLLEGAMEDPELRERWLKVIYDESQRLERLINDLLDLSMLEAEQVELHFKKADIRNVINQVISLLHPLASKEKIDFAVQWDDDIPMQVVIDEDRIKQVLVNLIHNAVKYSPSGSQILITAEKQEREIKISVVDKGTGVPKHHISRVFERFYRAEKDRTGKSGGRGLGLAIAQHIVEIHGGAIGAESEAGSGSTFYFTIPLDFLYSQVDIEEEDVKESEYYGENEVI